MEKNMYMDSEEIRLRALLAIRNNDNKYVRDIPSHMQFAGLYPERMGLSKEEREKENIALSELKERLDNELK